MPKKPSLDEILAKREGSIHSTDRGDAIVKAFKAPATWNPDARSARFVMSSQAEDRYGDIVVTEGIEVDNFLTNPVVLLFHASRSWPVGQWSDIEKMSRGRPPRLEGTATFVEEGLLPEADTAASLIAAGVLRACSIGFIPLDWESIKDEDGHWTWGIEWLKSELVECSIVSVPASPQALVKAAGDDPKVAQHLLQQALDDWRREAEDLGVSREAFVAAIREYDPAKTIVMIGADARAKEEPEEREVEETLTRAAADVALQKDIVPPEPGQREVVTLGIEVDEQEIQEAADQAVSQLGESILSSIAKIFRVKRKEPTSDDLMPRAIGTHKVLPPVKVPDFVKVGEAKDAAVAWPTAETCDPAEFAALPEEKQVEFREIAAKDGVEAADAALKAFLADKAPKPATEEQIAAAKALAAETRQRLEAKGLLAA